MRHTLPLSIALILVPAAFAEDEKVFSGPQPGEKLAALRVLGIDGDHAGKEVDFVAEAKGKPTLLLFVHDPVTRPSAGVLRALTGWADARKKDDLKVYVVWLGPDRTKSEEYVKRARHALGKAPIGVSVDGVEGPGAYGLNRKVGLTILVAKDNKVTANFALVQPSIVDTPKIAEAVVKQIGGDAPQLKELDDIAYPKR